MALLPQGLGRFVGLLQGSPAITGLQSQCCGADHDLFGKSVLNGARPQTYVLKSPGRTVLIDTGVGNGKQRWERIPVEHSSTDQSTRIDAHLEKKYTVTLDLEAPPTRRCQARVSIEYLQKNTDAAVNSTLENPDCEASSGSYTIAVRYKDESLDRHEYL